MSRRLLLLAPALAVLAVVGCPLDIQVRCDESFPCNAGQECVAGACVRVEASQVGEACASDTDCGTGLTCGTGFPGGYCLAECGTDGTCPSGSICVEELGRCLRACGEACSRPGYACVPVPQPGSATQACAPASGDTEDGGTEEPSGDAGCAGTVPLGGSCSRPCDCATPGADCQSDVCVLTCARDTDCPEDRRCNEASDHCEPGPRLGESCETTFDCQTFATCNDVRKRCEVDCFQDASCPPGYRCSPDELCVEQCPSAPPETVGLTCQDSMDCARCGFCIASNELKQCRQPCQLDRECPGGAPGVCEQLGSTSFRACRLP